MLKPVQDLPRFRVRGLDGDEHSSRLFQRAFHERSWSRGERIAAAAIPSSKLDESLNIATWNIREFGRRPRLDASLHYIAEIIGQFDLVAVVLEAGKPAVNHERCTRALLFGHCPDTVRTLR